MSLKAVLFDHDGVLVASEPLHRNAWKTLFKKLNLPVTDADIASMVGKTAPQTLEIFLNRYRPHWSRSAYPLDELAQEKNNIFLELVRHTHIAFPGVEEGLRELRARGIKTAVVSNAKRRELEIVLKATNLYDLFDVVTARDDTGTFKPDPFPYVFTAGLLELGIDECIAIEDSPPGIEAALVAGIRAAAVLTSFSREVMQQPVPGRYDLRPFWIGKSMIEFFAMLRTTEL